ncbi:hypothetical protein [Micromonospora sp. CPCC 206061]|uniref:hypothetical protein n=1 Tax=Micromonospora sp. CPCC 206061 TaxID=3122410 RepID=UPI002FEEC26C
MPVGGPAQFSGTAKVKFCRRLDNWAELADYFEVPPHTTASFEHGNQPRRLWESLEIREQLFALPEALEMCGRPDLAQLLRADTT